MKYLTNIERVPDPVPQGLPDNFGEQVWLSKRVSPYGYECYGYIIGYCDDKVKVAYYRGRHKGYETGWFKKKDVLPSGLGRKPLTYEQVIDKGIEV